MDVVEVVSADHGSGLEAEGIDAAAVAEAVHHVVDVVVLDPVLLARCGLRVPLPTDRDPRVRQVVNEVVRDHRALGKPYPDADRAVELHPAGIDMIVADAVGLGHLGLRVRTRDQDAIGAHVEHAVALDEIFAAAHGDLHATAAQAGQHPIFDTAMFGPGETNGRRDMALDVAIMARLDAHVALLGQFASRCARSGGP